MGCKKSPGKNTTKIKFWKKVEIIKSFMVIYLLLFKSLFEINSTTFHIYAFNFWGFIIFILLSSHIKSDDVLNEGLLWPRGFPHTRYWNRNAWSHYLWFHQLGASIQSIHFAWNLVSCRPFDYHCLSSWYYRNQKRSWNDDLCLPNICHHLLLHFPGIGDRCLSFTQNCIWRQLYSFIQPSYLICRFCLQSICYDLYCFMPMQFNGWCNCKWRIYNSWHDPNQLDGKKWDCHQSTVMRLIEKWKLDYSKYV